MPHLYAGRCRTASRTSSVGSPSRATACVTAPALVPTVATTPGAAATSAALVASPCARAIRAVALSKSAPAPGISPAVSRPVGVTARALSTLPFCASGASPRPVRVAHDLTPGRKGAKNQDVMDDGAGIRAAPAPAIPRRRAGAIGSLRPQARRDSPLVGSAGPP